MTTPPPAADRIFRFVAWNDVHLTAPLDIAHLAAINVRAQWLRDRMINDPAVGQPDLIASVGDLIHGCTEDHWLELFANYLKPMAIPLLPCAGNHDNRSGTDNTNYDRFFGPAFRNYCYAHSGVGFVVIDSSNTRSMSAEHAAHCAAFFRRALDHLGDRPVFVLTHVPLVTVRDEAVFQESFPHKSYKQLFPQLLDAINAQADRVIAVISGHVHLTGVRTVNNVTHIVPCGTATYPCEFATFDVYPSQVHMRITPLPDAIVHEPTLRNLHGHPDHDRNFSDTDHRTPEAYSRGNADERDFTLPLKGHANKDVRLTVWTEARPGQFTEAALAW